MIIDATEPGTIRIKAPAKLNLFLEVAGRRPDGYHDIETVMHAVDLCDEVSIERGPPGVRFSCTGLEAGPDPQNLAHRAARAFAAAVPSSAGVSIRLVKNIPAGAGLGGGSSDAAAVLAGLNELNGRPLPRQALASLGESLGADVPFFFTAGTAVCTGKGERVEPIPGVGPYVFLLVYPGFPSSTRTVYENLNLGLTKGKKNIRVFVDRLKEGDLKGIYEVAFNRLQQAAFRTTPGLEDVWRLLRDRGFGEFQMTGSGSALFRAIDPGQGCAPEIGAIRTATPWQVFQVSSLLEGTSRP